MTVTLKPTGQSFAKAMRTDASQYGQKTSETNLNGVVTDYYYGGDGSRFDQADTDPSDTGDLIAVVQDPTGLARTTTMHYDAAGRVLSSTDPLDQQSAFTYNTLGQPISVATPARGSAPAETITYTYDNNGRTGTVTDNRGTTSIAYQSGTDFVASVTDPVTGTVSYTYGPWGERLTMTLPGGGTWHYAYDTGPGLYGGMSAHGSNQYYQIPDPTNFDSVRRTLTSITDDQGRAVCYTYTDTGKITGALSDQVFSGSGPSSGTLVSSALTQYDYNDINTYSPAWAPMAQLTNLATSWTGPGGSGNPVTRPLSSNAYTYDDDSDRLTNAVTTGTQATRTETYGYDDLSRLTSVNYGDGQTQSYVFDPMGNRLQRQDSASGTTNSQYNNANMLTATTGTGASSYTSDADGDTLSGGGRTMAWDSQNRLVSCLLNNQTSAFTYGADGLRRSMTVGSGPGSLTTDYAYDGQSMLREMQVNLSTGSLAPTATYLTGPRGPEYRRDATQTETDGQGHTYGKTRWYVYDGLGSVVGEVDPLGNLTCSDEYDVYGAVRGRVGTASTAHGFVGGLGHLSDGSTGLIYMRARYYDPGTGRFISEDPKQNGMDWFDYSDGNPVNEFDLDGKAPSLVDKLSGAALAGFLTGFVSVLVGDQIENGKINWVNAVAQGAVWGGGGALAVYLNEAGLATTFAQTVAVLQTVGRLAIIGIGAILVVAVASYAGALLGEMLSDAMDEL